MKKYLPLLLILFTLLSCKTTPEDYSKYTFIDQGIKSDKYEVVTLMNGRDKLTNAYGYYAPLERVVDENSDSEKIKTIMAIPFLLFNESNLIYFTIDSKKNKYNYLIEYNINENKTDSIEKFSGDNYSIWQNMLEQFFTEKEKKEKLVNFKFPQAEKYYKVIEEKYHSEISEKEKNEALEEYKDSSEEIKQAIIEIRSIRYNTIYSELQMPKEKIKFKFNSYENKKIEFFGNEDLYKKGYIYVYIYNKLSLFPHSGGLYVIRPKAIK